MTQFEAKLQNLTVTATSPDKTVTLTFRRPNGMELEFRQGALTSHTEDSLSRQVAAAARGALAGYRQQMRRAIDEILGDDSISDAAPTQKHQAFRDRQADITSYGRSGRGYVLAKRHAKHGIAVQIQPRTLAQLSASELSTEIGSALMAALKDHREKVRALRRETFV